MKPKEIKTRRLSLGYTQTQLAKRARVSQALVSKLEKGIREPRFSTMVRILNALKMSVTIGVDE